MSVFATAIEAGESVIQMIAGSLRTFRRGNLPANVVAVVGQETFNDVTRDGATIRRRIRDYLVAVDDLRIGGKLIEPQAGDVMEEPDGARFEVYAPAGDGKCWRYSTPQRNRFRIHTREIR